MIQDVVLKEFVKDQLNYRIDKSKSSSPMRKRKEKYMELADNIDLNNGSWKIVIQGNNKTIRKIEKGSLPKLLFNIDSEYYSSNAKIPKYSIEARIDNLNVELPASYWIEFIRNKEDYILKYNLDK